MMNTTRMLFSALPIVAFTGFASVASAQAEDAAPAAPATETSAESPAEAEDASPATTEQPAEGAAPEAAPTPKTEPAKTDEAGAPSDDISKSKTENLGQGTGRTLSERVRAVSGKVFIKKGRFELSPQVGVSINDAFFMRTMVGGRATYHLFEALSLDAGFAMNVFPVPLPAVRTVRAEVDPIRDEYFMWGLLDAGATFSPLYGKFALMSEWTVHFDTYVHGGIAGIMDGSGETFWGLDLPQLFDHPLASVDALGDLGYVPTPNPVYVPNVNPAAQIGIGGRVFVTKWMVLRADLRNYFLPRFGGEARFPPRKIAQLPVRHIAMLHVGVGFYFPLDFEEEYAGAKVVEP